MTWGDTGAGEGMGVTGEGFRGVTGERGRGVEGEGEGGEEKGPGRKPSVLCCWGVVGVRV